jgi:hypothetical protein
VQYEEADKVHVRVKTKKYTINDEISWITDFNKWMSFKSIIMVESTRCLNRKESYEKRY